MRTATARSLPLDEIGAETPHVTTLLELVRVLSEVTDDDREVVATVLSLLRSGKVRLCGNFRGVSPEDMA